MHNLIIIYSSLPTNRESKTVFCIILCIKLKTFLIIMYNLYIKLSMLLCVILFSKYYELYFII